MPPSAWTSLIVFSLAYLCFVLFPNHRSWTACGGAALLVALGAIGWRDALLCQVNWNVMGLFFGTLVLAGLFLTSRAPAVLAERLVAKCRGGKGAMLTVCALSGIISIFVENVAVVLLVAPIALSLAKRLETSPVPLLIGIAISSNLQGTATMVGDPPSMILAGALKLGFWDFFFYQGRPGIFFAIETGAIASLFVLAWAFRDCKDGGRLEQTQTARSWTPATLLVLLIVGLSFSSTIDPGFRWFAGTYTIALAIVATLWSRFIIHWSHARSLLKSLDWDTTFFLLGVFILVGALGESGWMDILSRFLGTLAGGSKIGAYALVTLFAVAVSAFVDNTPFLLVMIPVVQKLAETSRLPLPLLMFGLLIGSCLGGNITPVGASANVVALGILRKQGHSVGFGRFMRLSVPFTLAALLAGALFVWLVWGI